MGENAADQIISACLRGVSVDEAITAAGGTSVVSGGGGTRMQSGAMGGGKSSMPKTKPYASPSATGATMGAGARKPASTFKTPTSKPYKAPGSGSGGFGGGAGGMSESFMHGSGLQNDVAEVHHVLLRNGYFRVEDAQSMADETAGRERFENRIDSSRVVVDLSIYDNSPGKVGAWTFTTEGRPAVPGFGCKQLEQTLLLHQARKSL